MKNEKEVKANTEGLQESEVANEGVEKDTVDKPKKERKSAKKTYEFNPKAYKCMVEIEESVNTRYVHRGRLVEEMMPTGRMIEVEKFRPDYISANKGEDVAKCRFRAAEYFEVNVEHLIKAYDTLNSKKLDGFYITDLIDRFGFSKGARTAINRSALAKRYGRENSHCIDVAQEKLKGILQNNNIQKAYKEHIDLFKEEFSRETDSKTIYGE
jgi:hypothetical protein